MVMGDPHPTTRALSTLIHIDLRNGRLEVFFLTSRRTMSWPMLVEAVAVCTARQRSRGALLPRRYDHRHIQQQRSAAPGWPAPCPVTTLAAGTARSDS